MGGRSLYVKDGKPKYACNWLAREMYNITSDEPLFTGKVSLVFQFDYDGGGLNKGATGTLFVNGKKSRLWAYRKNDGRNLFVGR
jgi:hypothetical protein